jgi:hypothetical protein
MTTKEAAPAVLPQGLFLAGRRQMVFNPARVARNLNQQNDACTSISKMGDQECLLPPAE